MITGLFAFKILFFISSRVSLSGVILYLILDGFPKSISDSAFKISPGRDINTGPVGGANAIFAALLSILGRSSSLVTSIAHFTRGSAI